MKKRLWTTEIDRVSRTPDPRLRERQLLEAAKAPRDSLWNAWASCRDGRVRLVVTVNAGPECGVVPLDDLAALETDNGSGSEARERETLIVELGGRNDGIDGEVYRELLDALNILRKGAEGIRIVFTENATPALAMVDLEDLAQLDETRRPFKKR